MPLPFKWMSKKGKSGLVEESTSPNPFAILRNLQERLQGSRNEECSSESSLALRLEEHSEYLNESEERRDRSPRFLKLASTSQREVADLDSYQRAVLSRIAVVAFVGPSGTGKSTQALRVAKKHQIEYLIDDGLLIHGSRILAGSSAKKAKTKLESVRQALFLDPTRAEQMRRTLMEQEPTTLMILGTSDNMLQKICQALWLNPPSMLIRIEDVTSESQRRLAKQTRLMEGQHTIPVPSMEIKHEFSGYFADPIQRLRQRLDRQASNTGDSARTVVRPTFSTLGSYSMSDEALKQMVEYILLERPGVATLQSCRIKKEVYGIILHIELGLYFAYNAQDVLREAQQILSQKIELYTSINVLAVNLRASRLVRQNSSTKIP